MSCNAPVAGIPEVRIIGNAAEKAGGLSFILAGRKTEDVVCGIISPRSRSGGRLGLESSWLPTSEGCKPAHTGAVKGG